MKQSYTCIIVDDEPKTLEQLSDIISELYDSIEIIGQFDHWKNAFAALRSELVDILLLDIIMPQKSGLELLKLLPGLESEIIFVTADPSYALQSFDFQPTGYVLKPLEDAVLKKAIDKAIEHVELKRLSKQKENHVALSKIGIPSDNGIEYINIADILYFEGMARYTRIKLVNGEVLSSYSIGKFKNLISRYPFFQVHRSFIIHLNYVNKYESSGVVRMDDHREIPVAKQVRLEFLSMFNKIGR